MSELLNDRRKEQRETEDQRQMDEVHENRFIGIVKRLKDYLYINHSVHPIYMCRRREGNRTGALRRRKAEGKGETRGVHVR